MSESPHKHDLVATVAVELSAWLLNEAQLMSIDENTRWCKENEGTFQILMCWIPLKIVNMYYHGTLFFNFQI